MPKKKPGEIAARVTLAVCQEDWDMVQEALRVMFQVPDGEDHGRYYSRQERGHFFRQCLFVVSRAIVKAGCKPAPLAVDLRHETEEETAMRIGKDPAPGVKVF
jgi:hypothetical protein